MIWKISLSVPQAQKLLRGEGVNLKYHQLFNGNTTIELDHTQAERLARCVRRQRGFQLRFSEKERTHHQTEGDGIFNTLRRGVERFFAGPASHASPAVRQAITADKSNVTEAWLFRTPLSLIVKFVALWLSDGRLDDKRRELNANDVYHTGFIFTLDTGKRVRVEKNHVVEVTDITQANDTANEELMPVGLSRRIPLEQWIINAEQKHGSKLFQYTPGEANCSRFCEQMLGSNPISSGSVERSFQFIHQESAQLYATLSEAGQTLGNVATNLAGRLDRVMNGDGVK